MKAAVRVHLTVRSADIAIGAEISLSRLPPAGSASAGPRPQSTLHARTALFALEVVDELGEVACRYRQSRTQEARSRRRAAVRRPRGLDCSFDLLWRKLETSTVWAGLALGLHTPASHIPVSTCRGVMMRNRFHFPARVGATETWRNPPTTTRAATSLHQPTHTIKRNRFGSIGIFDVIGQTSYSLL